MDITELLNTLRQDLARAAEVGGEDVKAAAERLLLALDPALRLTLMEAFSQAATDIGAQLPGVAISVRLQGREPSFVVEGAPPASTAPPPEEAFEEDGGEATARITLRIPESIKAKAEALAARRGQSLNTWLVGAARAALWDRPHHHHFGDGQHGFAGRRMKGWVR
ncbi:MAG TPA: toxin-antitoxin system HicB family antitoxin [Caulobacteraceae bacterium]|jgi:hypothetical protein|nr:toxin-antitoxin system HicB family antitoxin [Caulobacteraceae bacterium]